MGAPQSTKVMAAGLTLLAAVAVLAVAPPIPAAERPRIKLPTPADAVAPKTPLIVPRAGEVDVSKVPGPVNDTEVARIALGPDGRVVGVSVTQTLMLRGVGDFNVVLPGPALHVVGPSDQATQPGLRRGTILWQGFVPGSRTLRATATLDPTFERFRVPLQVSVRFRQDGRDVNPPVTGPVEIQITISNNTGQLVPLADGVPRAAELAGLLDAIRDELRLGRAPIAGERDVPTSLGSSTAPTIRRASVEVPFSVAGSIGFTSGVITDLRVAGPAATTTPSGAAFSALLPSTRFPNGMVVIRLFGDASHLGAPQLQMHAEGALPERAQLDPPNGATWRDALAGTSERELRAGLSLAERTLWQVLRAREFDAYLGNPGAGTSSTSYEFSSARPAPGRVTAAPERVKSGAVALTLFAAALVVANAAALWARS